MQAATRHVPEEACDCTHCTNATTSTHCTNENVRTRPNALLQARGLQVCTYQITTSRANALERNACSHQRVHGCPHGSQLAQTKVQKLHIAASTCRANNKKKLLLASHKFGGTCKECLLAWVHALMLPCEHACHSQKGQSNLVFDSNLHASYQNRGLTSNGRQAIL